MALHGLQRAFSVANVGSSPQAAAETCPHQTLLEALGCLPPSFYLQEEAVQATPACWDPASEGCATHAAPTSWLLTCHSSLPYISHPCHNNSSRCPLFFTPTTLALAQTMTSLSWSLQTGLSACRLTNHLWQLSYLSGTFDTPPSKRWRLIPLPVSVGSTYF